jgi:hypothetical protein
MLKKEPGLQASVHRNKIGPFGEGTRIVAKKLTPAGTLDPDFLQGVVRQASYQCRADGSYHLWPHITCRKCHGMTGCRNV